jgi:hypothetical protein
VSQRAHSRSIPFASPSPCEPIRPQRSPLRASYERDSATCEFIFPYELTVAQVGPGASLSPCQLLRPALVQAFLVSWASAQGRDVPTFVFELRLCELRLPAEVSIHLSPSPSSIFLLLSQVLPRSNFLHASLVAPEPFSLRTCFLPVLLKATLPATLIGPSLNIFHIAFSERPC